MLTGPAGVMGIRIVRQLQQQEPNWCRERCRLGQRGPREQLSCAEEANTLGLRQARHPTLPVLAIAGASNDIARTHITEMVTDCGIMGAPDERCGKGVCTQQFTCRNQTERERPLLHLHLRACRVQATTRMHDKLTV